MTMNLGSVNMGSHTLSDRLSYAEDFRVCVCGSLLPRGLFGLAMEEPGDTNALCLCINCYGTG
jgi:hypothetical protein